MAAQTSLKLVLNFQSVRCEENSWVFCCCCCCLLQGTQFLNLKGKWTLENILLQKEILKCSHCSLGLTVKRGIIKSQVLLEPPGEAAEQNGTDFPSISTQLYNWARDPFCWIFWLWKYDLRKKKKRRRRGRAVVLHIQDEFYWSSPDKLWISVKKRICCYSWENSEHYAAAFNLSHTWAIFSLFNTHQE